MLSIISRRMRFSLSALKPRMSLLGSLRCLAQRQTSSLPAFAQPLQASAIVRLDADTGGHREVSVAASGGSGHPTNTPYGQKIPNTCRHSAQPTHHGLGQGTGSVGLGPGLMLGVGHQNRVVVFTMGRGRFIRCTAHIKQWVT